MDPDEALRSVRAAVEKYRQAMDGPGEMPDTASWWADLAEELAEPFAGLDEWLSRGGFLPAAWQSGTAAERPTARRTGGVCVGCNGEEEPLNSDGMCGSCIALDAEADSVGLDAL